MKIKQLICKQFVALMTLAMVMGIATSCTSDPVDMIPDDVDFVMALNLQRAADNTDFVYTDTEFTFPEDIKAFAGIVPGNVEDALLTIHKSIDLSKVYVFGYYDVEISSYDNIISGDAEVFAVAKIKDKDALEDAIEEAFDDPKEEEGFDVYTRKYSIGSILIKDGYVWVYGSEKAGSYTRSAAAVKKVIDKAGDKNITDVKGLAEVLAADKIAVGAMKMDSFLKPVMEALRRQSTETAVAATIVTDKLKNTWGTMDFDIEGLTATMTAKYIKPDGQIVDFSVGQNVNDDIFSFLSPDYFAVAAVGLNADDVNNIAEQLTKLCNSSMTGMDRTMMLTLIEHLRQVDGTVAVALGANDIKDVILGGRERELEYLICVNMKPGAPEKFLDAFTYTDSLSYEPGKLFRSKEDNMIMGSMYVQTDDTHFVLSNVAIRNGIDAKPFDAAFQGNQAAIAAYLPLGVLTDGRCDAALAGDMTYDKGVLTMTMSIENSKADLAGSIFNIVTSIGQAYNEWFERNYSYSGYYDYGYSDYDSYAVDSVAVDSIYYGY